MKKKCENCKWYRWEDSVWGHCHRFPPKKILRKRFPKLEYRMEYPEVYADYGDFCGEYNKN